jgi:hypothetical protein
VTQAAAVTQATSNSNDNSNNMTAHKIRNKSNSRNESNSRTAHTGGDTNNRRNASKSNEAGNSMQRGQQQQRHHLHAMAAAAIEKPETFSRDANNSSRKSQQGMANLRYFDIEPLRFWPSKITQSLHF